MLQVERCFDKVKRCLNIVAVFGRMLNESPTSPSPKQQVAVERSSVDDFQTFYDVKTLINKLPVIGDISKTVQDRM